MKLAVGSDHAAVELKTRVIQLLESKGIEVQDMGTHDRDSVDYPDFGMRVASAVSNRETNLGILMCGSGIGMSIVANKYPGVRAALCHDLETARLSRGHNDANILVMGGRLLKPEEALEIVRTWLETPFEGGRHQKRIQKITKIESTTMSAPRRAETGADWSGAGEGAED